MRNFTQRIAKLLAQEDGDVALVDWRGNVLSTIVALICTLVFPATCVLGQIGGPLRYARLGDRTDEQIGAEHIFVFLLQRLWVVSKVEHEGAHQRIAFGRDALCTLLDVRQQARALLDALTDD